MPADPSFDIGAAVAAAKSTLTIPAPAPGQPVLVMLCGLPGTGKSTIARRLATRLPAVVVEADRVRQKLFSPPTYSAWESQQVHRVCHTLIGWYLRRYYHVVYDATNLYEYHRAMVYRLAARSGARLVVAEIIASEEVVRQRLAPRRRRDSASDASGDYSEADWEVYLRMRRRAEPIEHQHITVDTSDGDVERALECVLAAIGGPIEKEGT
ncbi:MAG: AAA family ATPase [Anaerolineae bacterium]